MIKVNSEQLVCTAEQSQQLMALGILPISCMCYQFVAGDEDEQAHYEYAGEYLGEEDCIPAWTMGELHILIGGSYHKPDIRSDQEWTRTANMLEYVMYLPSKRRNFPQGAQAAAAFLEHLLAEELVKAADCNARLAAFGKDERHNPASVALDKLQYNNL